MSTLGQRLDLGLGFFFLLEIRCSWINVSGNHVMQQVAVTGGKIFGHRTTE